MVVGESGLGKTTLMLVLISILLHFPSVELWRGVAELENAVRALEGRVELMILSIVTRCFLLNWRWEKIIRGGLLSKWIRLRRLVRFLSNQGRRERES